MDLINQQLSKFLQIRTYIDWLTTRHLQLNLSL